MIVRFALRAIREANRIDAWWRRHRPAARNLFVDELGSAVAVLRHSPRVGDAYSAPGAPDVRRVLLVVTRVHIYYVVDVASGIVTIISAWSAVRGRGPRLRARSIPRRS